MKTTKDCVKVNPDFYKIFNCSNLRLSISKIRLIDIVNTCKIEFYKTSSLWVKNSKNFSD